MGRRRHDDRLVVGHVLRAIAGDAVATVAGGEHDNRPEPVRGSYRVFQDRVTRTRKAASPTVVDDIRPVLGGVDQGRRQTGATAAAAVVQPLDRHDLCSRGDADDADGVIADRRDRAGHVRPVAVAVERVVVVAREVPAVDVIHEAIAVVVEAVAGDFRRMRPDIGGDVRMRRIEAGIHHRDDGARPLGRVPRRPRLNQLQRPQVVIGLAPRAAGAVVRVIRGELDVVLVIGLGVQDVGVGLEPPAERRNVGVGMDLHRVDLGQLPLPRLRTKERRDALHAAFVVEPIEAIRMVRRRVPEGPAHGEEAVRARCHRVTVAYDEPSRPVRSRTLSRRCVAALGDWRVAWLSGERRPGRRDQQHRNEAQAVPTHQDVYCITLAERMATGDLGETAWPPGRR